ncbi:MAG: sugar transferase [Pseudobdellovibrionaceae bacterium]
MDAYLLSKRIFDIVFSALTLVIFFPLILIIYIYFKVYDQGPFLFWSKRVGINSTLFLMPKIRSMHLDTPQVATHLLSDGKKHLTPIGAFLRRTSLDEIPQLFSILKGDMSFVGPRPALFNQEDLIALRCLHGVDRLVPGLTGWAQINGRDEISITQKVELEKYYLQNKNFFFDLKIIFLTVFKVLRTDGIIH